MHGDLAKIELETLSLMEILHQDTPIDLSSRVSKEGDKIAALEIAENINWLQVIALTNFKI